MLESYLDMGLPRDARVNDLFSRLTFEEKLILCAGERDNATAAIPRLKIPRFRMTDGPNGVAPYALKGISIKYDAKGIPIESKNDQISGSATYFPTGIQQASTWNPALIEQFGKAIGEEMRAAEWQMWLGPAINMCRNPLNGRTFEYYTEDPYLAGEIGVASVKGVQSQRVSVCLKHFVANSQETSRFLVNAIISQRALHEIYYPHYKRVVEGADPWGVMSSYNKVNGLYISEHKEILRETLMGKWGFRGVVVSDWGACNRCTTVEAMIEAGLCVEMGSRRRFNIEEMQALKISGKFPEAAFDNNIKRFLRVMFLAGIFDDPTILPKGSINTPEHQLLARKIAEEGMILLKNDKNLLPLQLDKIKKIALLGKHADLKFGRKKTGGGSSAVFPPYEITIREGLQKRCQGKIEIIDDPKKADVAIVCIGLEHTHDFKGGDHEGSDRLRYSLGILQPLLVRNTVRKNPNTIVICVNGTPFGIESFVNRVSTILEAWYGGMEIGNAVAGILFGDVNPSGKLPVSWPKHKKDIPTALTLLQTLTTVKEVHYNEGILIGYRYYDTKKVEPRFCFGHGLSYTSFDYSDLKINSSKLIGDENLNIQIKVINSGQRSGAEIVQLYIHNNSTQLLFPNKELKGFKKIILKPAESTIVEFFISKKELAYFNESKNDWVVEPGTYDLLIGKSSRDIQLTIPFNYSN